ncbi:MAG: hypothetical protein RLZZ15_2754 [Verrucomicrobiota bacterium]
MDKKNTTIGVLLIVAAFAISYFMPKPAPAPTPPPAAPAAAPAIASPASAVTPDRTTAASASAATASAAITPAPVAAPAALRPDGAYAALTEAAGATVTTLANDFIEVRFTDAGGAIRDVAFKKYPAALGSPAPYVFNARHADPMLALVDFPGLDRRTRFERVSATATEIVYRAVLGGRLEVTRRYVLAPNAGPKTDPYQLRHETTFRNLSDQPAAPLHVALALGTAEPANAQDPGQYTTTGHSTAGKQTYIPRGTFDPSTGFPILGWGAHGASPPLTTPGPHTWVTVKNQFFLSLLTPDAPATGLVSGRVKLREAALNEPDYNTYGIAAAAQFDVKGLPAGGEAKLGGALYVGPKEYSRLSNIDVFKADEDQVLDFGFFGWASKILLSLMTKIHNVLPNTSWSWGVAIILTTLTLKLVFLWPTFAGARSMKRMSKLQPQMAAIKEKFKDNPQKQHAAQMELWKEHKVNPMSGCLPMLIPLPFFLGFFSMLQSTAELRFGSFLWATDLSAPDTVGHLGGIAINILPVLFTAVTFVQMRLTPTPNADPMQAKMMQYMPLIFLFIYYNFSCALSLYSMTNALFTIGQQMVINRMPDEPAAVTVGPGGKLVKNVTPKKKG